MNNDSRLIQLKHWLEQILQTNGFNIEVASADASFRRYFRVQYQQHSWIAMDAPPDREDCRAFIEIAQMIEDSGSHAPHIYHQDAEQGFMLLSDLGSSPYLQELNPQTARHLYTDALNTLIKMQNIKSQLPLYSPAILQQEMDLFNDWFLQRHLHIYLTRQQTQQLQNIFDLLIENAQQQPQLFVHRDYHSRNLMMTEKNNPGVIDFQDALIGPASYDLVSLLKDCYIPWPRKTQLDFVSYFYQHSQAHLFTDQQTFIKQYDLMGLQRHIKVAGIFCRLNYRDGKENYLNDLPLTLAYIADVCQRHTELQGLLVLLKSLDIQFDRSCLEKIQ